MSIRDELDVGTGQPRSVVASRASTGVAATDGVSGSWAGGRASTTAVLLGSDLLGPAGAQLDALSLPRPGDHR